MLFILDITCKKMLKRANEEFNFGAFFYFSKLEKLKY